MSSYSHGMPDGVSFCMPPEQAQNYGKEIFEYLLSVLDEDEQAHVLQWHCVREDGVYLRPLSELKRWDPTPEELKVMTWHPYRDVFMPALPFPFTAGQLAAFCLPGVGSDLIAAFVEPDGIDGRSESTGVETLDLNRLGPNAGRAGEALQAAHTLLLQAMVMDFERQSRRNGVSAREMTTSGPGLIQRQDLEDAQLQWLLREACVAVGKSTKTEETAPMPVSHHRSQELRILAALRKYGYEPLELPPFIPGVRGVKAEVRSSVPDMSPNVYKKAWQRLLEQGLIKYSER